MPRQRPRTRRHRTTRNEPTPVGHAGRGSRSPYPARNPGRLIHGEAISACAQSGQGNALAVVLDGQFQALPISPGQQSGLAPPATVPNRADGVDYVFRRELAGRGNDGRAGRATIGVATIRVAHDLWPPAAVDRSVDAATACQLAICRVHDSIDRLLCDVALVQFERLTVNFDVHGTLPFHRNCGSPDSECRLAAGATPAKWADSQFSPPCRRRLSRAWFFDFPVAFSQ